MNRMLRGTLLVLVVLSGLTGVVFAAMKYLMTSDDPFAAFHHPWQPSLLAAHVLVAPALLFTLGWVFANHVAPQLGQTRHARFSGVALVITIASMAVSGYLLQVVSGPGWRLGYAWVHGLSGTLFLLFFGAHAASAIGRSAVRQRRDHEVSKPAA